jgi:hypothetical protein
MTAEIEDSVNLKRATSMDARSRRPTTVEAPTRHPYDTATHIERINAGSNPADGTGASPGAAPGAPPKPADPADYGEKRFYKTRVDSLYEGFLLKAGSRVALFDHEVGAHHERISDEESL